MNKTCLPIYFNFTTFNLKKWKIWGWGKAINLLRNKIHLISVHDRYYILRAFTSNRFILSKCNISLFNLTDIVGLAFLVVCSVQKVKTTPVVSECSTAIHSTYQYTSDPCGGPCLHLSRDVLETRIKDMAGRANREITKYIAEVIFFTKIRWLFFI